jgi:hypothetical protein
MLPEQEKCDRTIQLTSNIAPGDKVLHTEIVLIFIGA